jgi:ABC-type polysaccharide/polyol phosphate transport system ATPase subunit
MLSDMDIIKFKNVEKKYRIFFGGGGTLRGEMTDLLSRFLGRKKISKDEFMALKGVSFSVPRGTTLGLIGSNGSGKSTILKMITKVTYPSSGSVSINGRVASLLEVGAGFHPEFTGRENIYLNGALLGLKRKEIDAKLNDIIEFSELRQFIDTPIKKYSSGMYVKLGFSVAIHVNPEILLVDEILAVGDAHFQNKCIKKMREIVSDSDKTVILVSHNMVTIQALCDQTLWIEKGTIRALDETSKVISMYSEEVNKRQSTFDISSTERHHLSDVYSVEIRTLDKDRIRKSSFYKEVMLVELTYKVTKPVNENIIITFIIEAVDLGLPVFSVSTRDNYKVEAAEGEHKVTCSIDTTNLYPRECAIRVMITSNDMLLHYDTWFDACRFNVIMSENDKQVSGVIADIVNLDYQFLEQTL